MSRHQNLVKLAVSDEPLQEVEAESDSEDTDSESIIVIDLEEETDELEQLLKAWQGEPIDLQPWHPLERI